jgi:glycosyltransferase involved in cell wall biosynthesis
MVSFQGRLASGLAARGIEVGYELEAGRWDAVLVVGGTRQLLALYSARRRGARIVQRLNGMNWIHRKARTGLRHALRSEANNAILAWIRGGLAHHIVYQSGFSQAWWERVYGRAPGSTSVVYNGVDLDVFSPQGPRLADDGGQAAGQAPGGSQGFCRVLLVEGHLGGGYAMGLENAVRLGGLLRQDHGLPVELMVVGDVPPSVRQKAEGLEAGAPSGARSGARSGALLGAPLGRLPVTWMGVVGREEIPAIDRSAHILFSADVHAACPNAVVEALACGLPVAAFDTGALREMVVGNPRGDPASAAADAAADAPAGCVVEYGSNPWNLEPPDLPGLARAMAEVLRAPERYRAAARRRAETAFSLDRMVDGYVQALLG